MSVIVKNMKMPSNCMACDLEEVDDFGNGYRCPLIYQGYTAKIRQEGKLPNCPLVELPEKHGRLVEFIDVATTTDDDDGTESVNLGEAFYAYFKMRESKSVIEAEGVEE